MRFWLFSIEGMPEALGQFAISHEAGLEAKDHRGILSEVTKTVREEGF
jgi:hypothetical protein